MTKRMLTMGTVHFQARAASGLHDRIHLSAQAAAVPWHVAVDVIKNGLMRVCREAATAFLREVAEWTTDRWAAEIRIANALSNEGPDPE